ncbi:MAG: class II aldolase/adducin family protein [Pseudomonadota bacterium]
MSTVAAADRPARYSEEEWEARVATAAAYRLVALYGWDDLIFTHISSRVPGPEHHFLINPYHMMFEEITASSLVKIDLEGDPVEPTEAPINKAGFVIHSALHAAREDAQCVIHLHTDDGQAVSCQADGLLPLNQTAMIIHSQVAYHDFEGIATELEERDRLVADLGDKSAMILRNHGTLAIGRSMAAAFMRIYFLERACTAQVRALTAPINPAPEGTPEKTAGQAAAGDAMGVPAMAWAALLRKLDRIDPSYKS